MDERLRLIQDRLYQGHIAPAEAELRDYLARHPGAPMALHLLGVCLLETGRAQEAARVLEAARAADPGHAASGYALGLAWLGLGRFADAEVLLARHVQTDAANAFAWNNLALAQKALGRLAAAETSFNRALRANANFDLPHANLANLLVQQSRYEEARTHYERALRINPGNALSRWNLGLCRLLLGDWPGAWQDYEARWHQNQMGIFAPREFFNRPWWRGQNPANLELFLHAEQGLGDSLQFVRYARELARHGARVTLEVPPPLLGLMRHSLSPAIRVIARGDAIPPFDLHAPLLSLPLGFQTTLKSIPAGIPYLDAPPEARQRWQDRLAPARGIRIGLVWASGISNPQRNVPLEALLSTLLTQPRPASAPSIEWIALQYDASQADREVLARTPDVPWVGAELVDFVETAAAVSQCDLIVSVDTAVAHLAGAMGKPVWILLPAVPDWRWQLHREDSPWYPTARLFRQDAVGDWASALQRLATAIGAISAGNVASQT